MRYPFGTLNTRNAAFVAMVCRDTIYKGYDRVPEHVQDQVFGQVLMNNRWDGCIGFPGGKVDGDETLTQAAMREVLEEVNFEIADPDKLIPIATHTVREGLNVHLFGIEISTTDRDFILENAHKGADSSAEVEGVMFKQISTREIYERWKAKAFLARSVPEEFDLLLDKMDLKFVKEAK